MPGPELDGERGLNVAGWANKLTGAATISMGSVGLSGDMLSTVKGESSAPAGLANLIARIERGAPAPEKPNNRAQYRRLARLRLLLNIAIRLANLRGATRRRMV